MSPHRGSRRGKGATARPLSACALAIALLSGAAQAATERATAHTDRTGARLVLEWQRPVQYSVIQTGSYVFVRFGKPFTGALDKARAPLGRYLAEMRLAGGGRVLVLRFVGEPNVAHQRRGNAIVLSWIGAPPSPAKRSSVAENPTDSDNVPASKGPKAVPAPPSGSPAPAATTSPPSARVEQLRRPAAPPVMHAEQPQSPKASGGALKTPRAAAEKSPARPAEPPASGQESAGRGPAAPAQPDAERTRPPATYRQAMLPPAQPVTPPARAGAPAGRGPDAPAPTAPERARPPASYTQVMIPPARPVAPPPQRSAQPSGPVPEGAAPEIAAPKSPGSSSDAPPRPASPPPLRVERPAMPDNGAGAPPMPASPRGEEAQPPPTLAKAPEMPPAKPPEIRTAPEARPAPDTPLEPPVMPAISPTLSVSSDSAETRVVVAWPEPVAAAVFRHGDYIWMVFPRREAFDVTRAQSLLGPGIERLVRIEHAQATVLAARARPDIRARVVHERNVWTIALRRDADAPPAPDVKLAISRGGIEQAALPLPGASSPIRITAPEAGSVLFAVPSRARAAASGERGFVTFRILPAVQGGLIEALADGIAVGAESGAVTIRRSGGLLISNGGPPGSSQHGQ
jgi:hypothetical protein